MALGLASVLDAVTAGTAPSRIIPMLAPYTSLSDLAPSVMMNLHELERIRRGEPGSQRSATLARTGNPCADRSFQRTGDLDGREDRGRRSPKRR